MKKESEQTKASFGQNLNDFFANNRFLMIIVVAIVLIGLIGTIITLSVINQSKINTNIKAEEIYEKYIEWIQAPEDEKDRKGDELLGMLNDILEKPSKGFAVQRAYFTKGQYYLEQEEWGEAAELFHTLGTEYPKSYLAPVSLINAASAYEMSGDPDKAVECYETVMENFKDSTSSAPEVCFNLGRLYEEKGDEDSALKYYETILSDYSESNWVNAANNRIISLKLDN